MKKILDCFWGFTPNPHQGSAIDLRKTTNKICDNKIYVIFYFFMSYFSFFYTTDSHFPNWSGLYSLWAISLSFVYTRLLVRAFPHLHKLNLTYHSKSSMLLAFCFLFICIIHPTQICLSSILLELLQLFQGIVCNNERLKGGNWTHELLGGR